MQRGEGLRGAERREAMRCREGLRVQSALRGEVQRGGAKGCKAERREGLRVTSSSLLAYQEENINKTQHVIKTNILKSS